MKSNINRNIVTFLPLFCFWIQISQTKSVDRVDVEHGASGDQHHVEHAMQGDSIPLPSALNNFNQGLFDKDKQQPVTTADPDPRHQSFICQPQITVNTPPQPHHVYGCNCSSTRNIISQEVQRIVNACSAAENRVEKGEEIKAQTSDLQLLHQAVADLTTVLKAFQNPSAPTPATSLPKDCSEVQTLGATNNGLYTVQPTDGARPFQVYCDLETDGGGWTVFQRRQDGSVDFFRSFASYRRGFGEMEGEFWLGNDKIHRLTSQDEYQLRIDLTDFDGNVAYAEYSLFAVGDLNGNYQLTIGEYSGTAGDALESNNGEGFTTKDRDNDNWAIKNCAQEYHGAWWHNSCYYASLNGDYLGGMTEIYGKGIVWYQWKGYYYSLKTTEMKFRMVDG